MKKLTKKELTKPLTPLRSLNEYKVTYETYASSTLREKTMMVEHEIEAARHIREMGSVDKIRKIELIREGVYA